MVDRNVCANIALPIQAEPIQSPRQSTYIRTNCVQKRSSKYHNVNIVRADSKQRAFADSKTMEDMKERQ